MNKPLLTCLLSLLIFAYQSSSHAQQPDRNFDSTFNSIATVAASENKASALSMAEDLLSLSETEIEKVKGMMLLATLHGRSGDYVSAIDYALQAEQLADKNKITDWSIRISGFLSTTFRSVGLFTEGKNHLRKAESLLMEKDTPPLFRMFLHQERAHYDIEEENWAQALKEIDLADAFFSAVHQQEAGFIFESTNLHLRGLCYMQLEKFDSSEHYFLKAEQLVKNKTTEIKDFIYSNLAELYLKTGDYAASYTYLDSALKYTESSNNFMAKKNTYKSLYDYYKSAGDDKNALIYQEKYINITRQQAVYSRKISNFLIEKYNHQLSKGDTNIKLLIWTSSSLLIFIVIGILLFAYYRRRQRYIYIQYTQQLNRAIDHPKSLLVPPIEEHQEEAEIIETVETAKETGAAYFLNPPQTPSADPPEKEAEVQAETAEPESQQAGITIHPETEQRLYLQLIEYEKEDFYLNKGISLSKLAAFLKSNTKYISYIINKYKGTDFSHYISELRINYIIRKLQNEPVYLEYKISALAEEAGFSSHSKFASIFKSVTGISPSAFISNIKRDQKQDGHI